MKEITQEEIKKIQLDILSHIDSFCSQNGLRYYLSGGSLIGAIRHKGFIPWDDDIDIVMLRSDYNRFADEYVKKDRSKYHLFSSKNIPNFQLPYMKVDDSDTIFQEEITEPIQMGVNIDIFPVDFLPNDKGECIKLIKKNTRLIQLLTLKRLPILRRRGFLKNLTLFCAHLALSIIPFHLLVRKITHNASKYKSEQTKYCGCVVWGYGVKEINLVENYKDSLRAKFEDREFSIPVGYDNYLTSLFGNYMQLPPEEKRITHHHFKAWWK